MVCPSQSVTTEDWKWMFLELWRLRKHEDRVLEELPTWLWKLYRIMKSWIRERKFEPGAKRKWETILGIYRWRGEGDNWRLQKQCFLNDEALQSLSNVPAAVVLLPIPGVIYTHSESNLSSGYQFHLEQFSLILVSHMSYLRIFLKIWCLGLS